MIKRLLLLFIVIANMAICAAEQPPVIVLLSDNTEAYQKPLENFSARIQRPVITYNLHGDIENAPSTLEKVINEQPALIFALGAKAAFFAKAATSNKQDIPVIFSMVLNWQRHKLMDGQANIMGIDNYIAPSTQLYSLSLIFPEVKRVGVLYSKSNSAPLLNSFQKAASVIGVDIVSEQVNQADELKQAYKKLVSKVDAVWLPADPVLYTLENTYWLNRSCLKDKMVCISHSDNIAKLGLLLTINPDTSSIGSQAAQIAGQVLEFGKSPASIGVQDPIGTNLTLNARTAKKIGIEIPDHAVQIANKVIQ